ncbi:MAG TPA: hypothetical protein VFW31_19250 [Candidatus Angelobacter sp.]|nr:hypothetical protein [Candidatus Angelobacter sp.]
MKNYGLLLTGCLLVMAGACVAQQSQPESLADMVKHSHKPAKKPVLALSDEDMPPPSAQPSQDADPDDSSNARHGAADTKSETTKVEAIKSDDKKNGKTAETKDQHTAELKQTLAKYQKEEDAWKNSMAYYEEQMENETSDFRRQMYQDSIDNDKKNAVLFQEKIDAIQAELNKKQADSGAMSDQRKDQQSSSQP